MSYTKENIQLFIDVFFQPLEQSVSQSSRYRNTPYNLSSSAAATITSNFDTLFGKTPNSLESLSVKKTQFLKLLEDNLDALGSEPLFLGVKRYGIWDSMEWAHLNEGQILLNKFVAKVFPQSDFSGASFPYPADNHYAYLLSDGRVYSADDYIWPDSLQVALLRDDPDTKLLCGAKQHFPPVENLSKMEI